MHPGLPDDVHNAAESAAADRHGNGSALVDGFHPTHHAVGGFHGDAAHAAFAEVLLHLEDDLDRGGHSEAVADNFDGLVDRGQVSLGELDVDRGSCDLNDVSYVLWHIS